MNHSLLNRRVIIVSDTLPVALVQKGGRMPAVRPSLADLTLGHTRRRRRGSIALNCDSLDVLPREPVQTLNPEDFELIDRTNHAAFWMLSNLNTEVVLIGKPVGGIESREFDTNVGLQSQIRDRYWRERRCKPVFVNETHHKGHWDGYCRDLLWPLLHYVLSENTMSGSSQMNKWDDYVKVNEAFRDVILSVWKPDDIVWIFDYQLMILPALLRSKVDDMTIGYYFRSPFPSSELFRCLPQAKEVLQGMLGANVIGFQTHGYARHFISSCTRILGHESTPRGVDNDGMPVNVVVQPIGIDPLRIHRLRSTISVKCRIETIKESFESVKIISGLESADQCRGIIHKLKSFEMLLTLYPEFIGKVALVQIIYSNADVRGNLDTRVGELASAINGRYGSLDFNPVHVLYQLVEAEEYLALLSAADVLLITSERDTVNTLVLDYIACQEDTFGIPIISEFIGLASFLPSNFQVNPWDHSGTAAVIREVLLMSMEEKKAYHETLSKFINTNTTKSFVEYFLSSIINSEDLLDAYQSTPFLKLDRLLDNYVEASKRLIFLDYDGTLTPIKRTPNAAIPSQEVIRSLRLLTADSRNVVYIISGRDQETLENWLGNIPRLGMSAEHGCFIRPVLEPGESVNWMSIARLDELTWKEGVTRVMEYYTERTPGSFIEFKRASITWHYRLADPEFGSWQSKELQNNLELTIASKYSVEIIAGKKNLEVRPKTSNKGEIIRMILERHGRPEFILCAGDDRTDEDMFRVLLDEDLSEWCFTCSIGASSKKTLARYHVNTPEQIVSLLMRLCSMVTERTTGLTM